MSTLTLAICARNAQDIIGDCLGSIAQQTVAPDEVIVAVDRMDDPTVAVATAHGARVIATDSTGLYEARNGVLAACGTDYLAFTDADCVLVPGWVETVRRVLDTKPGIAGGTGRHPARGKRNLAAWLHHMWYIVETEQTGETGGLIGGNSYFRTAALREAGGWLHLPGHSAAEDVYIAHALREAGHRLWFDEDAAACHDYERSLRGLWRKSVMMGKDIVVMMRASDRRDGLFVFTLAIPVVAAGGAVGLAGSLLGQVWGAVLTASLFLASLAWLTARFRSVVKALPRCVARWVLIWPYSWGILKGLCARVPLQLNEGTSTPEGSPLKGDAGGW